MEIKSISNLSLGNSAIPVFLPKTPKRDCIDALSIVSGDIIKQLDSFGLINRATLNQYLSYAEKERQLSCDKSLNIVKDLVSNLEITSQKCDSGYFYTTESPYNYKETIEGYAKGKSYNALYFKQEYAFKRNLKNLADNGTLEHAMELVKMLQCFKSQELKEIVSEAINENNAQICTYKNVYSLGKLTKQTPDNFIYNSLQTPIVNTIKTIRNNLSPVQQSVLNDFIFDEGDYSILTNK